MAFYIELIKTNQDEYFVYYTYQFSIAAQEYKSASGKTRYRMKLVSGKLKIDKCNGDVHTIELAENDEKMMYAYRAGSALKKHWEMGEFPDKTCWAS